MCRDDHLVSPEEPQRVLHRLDRVCLADVAPRGEALAVERVQHVPQPLVCRRAGAVVIRRPVPDLAVQGGAHDEQLGVRAGRPVLDLLSKRGAAERLVGDHKHTVPPVGPAAAVDRGSLRPAVALQHEQRKEDSEREPAGDRQADPGAEQDRGQRDRREQHGHHDREPEGVFLGAERVDHCVPPP
jgi:hypothetical protein